MTWLDKLLACSQTAVLWTLVVMTWQSDAHSRWVPMMVCVSVFSTLLTVLGALSAPQGPR